ncbi:MAG: type I-U CRISPR-associated RAMP protein Csb1/Cas7u [Syntrophaceae bacterium]
MFEQLKNAKRLLMESDLKPVQGNRFQPTGFPDIGAAEYKLADGTRMLLVESAQSMANHLERAILNANGEVIEGFEGLSYVRAIIDGKACTTTTSLIEAHRINSPWIINSIKPMLVEEMGFVNDSVTSIDWQKVAKVLFKYDMNSLLHGVFLVGVDSRLKVPRALSAFIEATNIQESVSGGAKFDHIDPTGKAVAPEKKTKQDVLGNIPFQRIEYTAENIKAYFNLDLGLIKSYELGPDAFDVLVALSIIKIYRFLNEGTRLRTACDLKMKGPLMVEEPQGFKLPEEKDLMAYIQEKINACKGLLADPPVTEIRVKAVASKKASDEDEEGAEIEEPEE